jgi:hypothetical protein
MDEQTKSIIDASIQLENNVASIYSIFYATFEQHAEFWWQLHLEERNHAALMRTVRDYFQPIGIFPKQMLCDNLEQIDECNRRMQELIHRYNDQPPDETEAFNIALQLEQSACETHYHDFVTSDNPLSGLFRRLNKDDIDHFNRIKDYMKQNNIAIREIDL